MRAKHPTAAAHPLLRLTSQSAAAPSERGGYAAAETIMRSAVHTEPAKPPDPRRSAPPTEAAR